MPNGGTAYVLTLVVQERQRLFREGLGLLLSRETDIAVVGVAISGQELVRACEAVRPSAVVMEADPIEWSADRLANTLRSRHHGIRIIGTYSALDPVRAARARQAGMTTLVDRRAGIGPLLDAVRAVSTGAPHVRRRQAAIRAGNSVLTEREREVLGLVGSGLSTREISGRLVISPKTVENHKQRIFDKLGVQSQAHAVAVAMRAGLLGLADVPGNQVPATFAGYASLSV